MHKYLKMNDVKFDLQI